MITFVGCRLTQVFFFFFWVAKCEQQGKTKLNKFSFGNCNKKRIGRVRSRSHPTHFIPSCKFCSSNLCVHVCVCSGPSEEPIWWPLFQLCWAGSENQLDRSESECTFCNSDTPPNVYIYGYESGHYVSKDYCIRWITIHIHMFVPFAQMIHVMQSLSMT